jgi:hypothetical protein
MSCPQRKVPVDVAEDLVELIGQIEGLLEVVYGLPDARALERTVHEGLKEIDRVVMEVCVGRKAEQAVESDIREVRCPHCEKGWAVLRESGAERYAVTVRGRVDYRRPVYRCTERDCQRERAPLDEELGLEGKEHLTPLVQKKAVWAGAMLGSFEKAEADMVHQAELAVSAKEIHRLTEKVGARALALQDQEVRERGCPVSLGQRLEVEEKPETVVIEMDGTCVMGRDGEGHEVKCATMFGLDARATTGSEGKERAVLLRRCYCATSRGIQAFRAMVWAMAVGWGVRTARRVVVVGDGIEWIWNLSADRFHFGLAGGGVRRSVEILDFYHAVENLAKARDAIFRDPEGSPAKQWYGTWRERIRQGKVDALIEELERRQRTARGETQRTELHLRAEYFRTHRDRMNYPKYEAQGLPIGSGAIEGTCKNLIKGRMDLVGQRWDADKGIERMVALRVRLFNQRFDDLWPSLKYQEAA